MRRKIFYFGHYIDLGNLLAEDLPLLKKWRNEQMGILRQSKPLTDKDQQKFYRKIKKDKKQDLFSITYKSGEFIGYCGFVNIDKENKRAEISFIAKTGMEKKHVEYGKIFSEVLRLLRRHAFSKLRLHKIFTETWAFRKFHISVMVKSGFKLNARLPDQVWKKGRFFDSLVHSIINKK